MVRSADNLLERMRQSPAGHGDEDMKTVLVGRGFRFRQGGKHTVYQHEKHHDLTISVPRHRNLKPWVARDVVKLMDTLSQREED